MNSVIYECHDKWNIGIVYYEGVDDCSGTATWELSPIPVSLIGWEWANCGGGDECLATFTSYFTNTSGIYHVTLFLFFFSFFLFDFHSQWVMFFFAFFLYVFRHL